ncbi:MAG: hypothetical protein IPL71_01850 [Anaerolineales bacterium]|uniref:hypothetical protein n=1 Tax=Candidatus Villigracilis proximus TaxID=3140683 RepID=UPI0031351C8B|nr:hypothetical protein [Anaerolineales bacterium]
MTKNAGLNWFWLPVPNGNYPMGDIHKRLIEAMPQLSQLLDEGTSARAQNPRGCDRQSRFSSVTIYHPCRSKRHDRPSRKGRG